MNINEVQRSNGVSRRNLIVEWCGLAPSLLPLWRSMLSTAVRKRLFKVLDRLDFHMIRIYQMPSKGLADCEIVFGFINNPRTKILRILNLLQTRQVTLLVDSLMSSFEL